MSLRGPTWLAARWGHLNHWEAAGAVRCYALCYPGAQSQAQPTQLLANLNHHLAAGAVERETARWGSNSKHLHALCRYTRCFPGEQSQAQPTQLLTHLKHWKTTGAVEPLRANEVCDRRGVDTYRYPAQLTTKVCAQAGLTRSRTTLRRPPTISKTWRPLRRGPGHYLGAPPARHMNLGL